MTTQAEFQDKIQAWLGSAMLLMASVFAVLIFSDRMDMPLITLPAVWYTSRSMHLAFCGVLFLAAAILLKSPPQHRRESRPLFQSCRLMTRQNCGLCEEALNTLFGFQEYLPPIQVVDIDQDPTLVRQFGESIPVIELDGRVRFRGAISTALFQRIVDAALLREANALEGVADSQAIQNHSDESRVVR